jgi:hypothetical protein
MPERVDIYVDESGHASQGDVFVLAGLAGTSRQWEGFAADWNDVLACFGLTETDSLNVFAQHLLQPSWYGRAGFPQDKVRKLAESPSHPLDGSWRSES